MAKERARKEYCQYCGRTDQGIDARHIIYRSQCGGDTDDNLISFCRLCHDKAHRKIISAKMNIVTKYKSYVAIRDTAYKRAIARAMILERDNKVPAVLISKMAEADGNVIKARDALDKAELSIDCR